MDPPIDLRRTAWLIQCSLLDDTGTAHHRGISDSGCRAIPRFLRDQQVSIVVTSSFQCTLISFAAAITGRRLAAYRTYFELSFSFCM